MAFEPVSKVMTAPDGSLVVAEGDAETGEFRFQCSGCPDRKERRFSSSVGAVLAASYHSDHDPFESSVKTIN
jgi:hypothetical protein